MRLHVLGLLVAGLTLTATPARADVQVTIADGHVTVSAKDATIRQILAEWARVGQTRIVNVERLGGAPLSLELTNVPEAQALDTLLRTVSGYLAAPRAVPQPHVSLYDRIFILPTSSGTPARAVTAAPQQAQPTFTPPPVTPQQPDDQNADEQPAQRAPAGGPQNPPQRGPIFNTFPQPAPVQQRGDAPQQSAPASAAPTAPAGVSTPGMVVPTPQQPGQSPGQQPGQSPGQQPGQPQPGSSSNVR